MMKFVYCKGGYMNNKLRIEVKRYLCRELKDYRENLKKLDELRADIIESSPNIDLGVPSSPNRGNEGQTAKVHELMTNKVITRLLEVCKRISKVLETLNDEEYEVYVRHFENEENATKICYEMHISESTFYRDKNKIIDRLAEEMGYLKKS